MNKYEFLEELEQLLYTISPEEKEEALQYYRDYFADAEIENEEEVIRSLGKPRQVAENILNGLDDIAKEKGEFSEKGFGGYCKEFKEEIREVKKGKMFNAGVIILLVIIGVFISPFFRSFGLGIIGVVFSIIVIALCIIFGVVIAGISTMIVSIYLLGAGIIALFGTPYGGLCLIGAACFLLGLGILLGLVGIKIVTIALPWIIQTIVKLCRIPFSKKGKVV